jgi:hypothetical protein
VLVVAHVVEEQRRFLVAVRIERGPEHRRGHRLQLVETDELAIERAAALEDRDVDPDADPVVRIVLPARLGEDHDLEPARIGDQRLADAVTARDELGRGKPAATKRCCTAW